MKPTRGNPAEPTLVLSGTPRCRVGEGWVELAAPDALLLAWLALEGPTPRERLATLLWPASDAESARNALRQRLFRLRKQCRRDLVGGTTTLSLAEAERHDLDGNGGGLLGELAAPEHEALDAWLQSTRQRRAAQAQGEAADRIDSLEARGDLAAALALARDELERDTLSEQAHRRVMRLHYLRGDRAAALLAFDRLENLLRHEVGTRPSPATLELLQTIEGEPAPAAAAAPPRRGTPVPVSVLRPPRLVGRDRELQALAGGWAAGQVSLLIGEAGMGKSRLLQALSAQVEGLVIAPARPGDTLVPYASFARLLHQLLLRVPGALTGNLREQLAPLLPGIAPPASAPGIAGRRSLLLAPVQQLLRSAAAGFDGLVLDDLHFADDASVELLQALLAARRGGDDAQRWCLGLRPPAPGSAAAAFVAAVTSALPVLQIAVQPLDATQVAELVDTLGLPGVRGAEIGPALWQRSGGNPLFALETLKVAWAEGVLGTGQELPRPPSLTQLIGQQLARLSPAALALARVAAIAGPDFALPLAEHVLGQNALQLADPWHELDAHQVLVGTEFAHDLVYEAVLAGVPAPIARHLHGQMAAWLEGHEGEPARVAAHWEAADQRERALPGLRAAAERAHLALREKERIGFLLRAAEIAEAAGERDQAYECLAKAVASHMNSIRQADGFPLLDRLDRLARDAAQRAQALGLRAWYCSQLGDLQHAVDLGDQALALAEPLADAALTGGIRQRLATALAMLGRFDAALPHFEAMQSWAEQHLQSDDLAEFHGNFAVVLDNLGQPARALPQHARAIAACERAGNHSQRATHLANQAVSRLNAGDVAHAESLLQQAQQLIQAFDLQGASAGFVAVLRMQCARALGRYRDALALADHAEELLRATMPARLPVVRLHRGHCWLDLGQYARAGQALRGGEGSLPPHLEARRLLLQARCQRLLGQDPSALLAAAADAAPRSGWPEVAMLVAAEAAIGLDLDSAGAALRGVLERAHRLGLQGAVLAILTRLADGGDAGAARAAAAMLPAVAPSLLTNASVWLACARAHAESGDDAAMHEALDHGRRWLRAAAAEIDEAFRESFLQRNPEHALLIGGRL